MNTVSFLRGDGCGGFHERVDYGTGNQPYSMVATDVTGDRRPDLLTTNLGTNSISVLRNTSRRGRPHDARVRLDPHHLEAKSAAPWLIAHIEPVDFDPVDIELSSVLLADSVPADSNGNLAVDSDGDGGHELVLRFSQNAIAPLLLPGANELKITGVLQTGEEFEGVGEIVLAGIPSVHLSVVVAPNPINPSGTLSFSTMAAGPVTVKLFDSQGRLARTLLDAPHLSAGPHKIAIDGLNSRGQRLATGIYFYHIATGDEAATGRVAIVK